MIKLRHKHDESLTLKAKYIGMFETWVMVWKDNIRRPDMDGYFINSTLSSHERSSIKKTTTRARL